MALFIKDIDYLPMTGSPQLKRGSIRIEGRRITAVGAISPQWGDEVIYGHDKLALPGFVNGHCHAAMTMLRGFGEGLPLREWLSRVQPAEAALREEDIYWASLLAQMEMMKAGVTCYADMYFSEECSLWALEESGIRAVLANGLVDDDGRGEGRLRAMLQWADHYRDDGRGLVSFALAPHAVYSCSEPFLRDIAFEARKRRLPLHIHIAETAAEQESCAAAHGRRVLPYLRDIGFLDGRVFAAHMIHLDEEEMDIAAEKDVRVVHCPQSNMKLASGVLPYRSLRRRGVTVGLGTDGAASNNDLDLREETRCASLLQQVASGDAAALPPGEALAMATREGAKALFLDDQIGTIEPGKLADITILSLWRPHFYPRNDVNDVMSHVVYGAKNGDVHTVIINGSVRVRAGKCVDIDESRVYHEIQKRAAGFWRRV